MASNKIFINYRREDSRADAGRLFDRLDERYPARVFRDVGSLEPGIEWRDAINKVLGESDACIVVIGKHWLSITDGSGKRRLDDPRDTVRQELETALKSGMRVFPILVGGAQMPSESDLPESLQPLARRNALEITEQDWNEDCEKLICALERSLGWTTARLPATSRTALPVLGGAVAGMAVLAIAIVLVSGVWGKKTVAQEARKADLSLPARPAPSDDVRTPLAAEPPAEMVPASDVDDIEPPAPHRAPNERAHQEAVAIRIQVTHRHGFNYRSFNRTTRCEGFLTIEPNGTISYECDPRLAHDDRCDRVRFPPGSFTFTAADDDHLHLATSTGNYDFFAPERKITAAVRLLTVAVPRDLRD